MDVTTTNPTTGGRLAWGAVEVFCYRTPLAALDPRPAVTVPPGCTLGEAIAVMEAAEVSALLLDDLSGIVTERDFTRAYGRGVALDEAVAAIATPDPVVVPGSTTVLEAGSRMVAEHLRHLVVRLDDGLGVVSFRALADVLLRSADPQIWLASLGVTVDVPSELWLG